MIREHAYPRVGLVGNPSDGFFGKTISFTFSNFRAEVILYESPDLEILPNTRDHSRFDGIDRLACDVKQYGYYGGIRLLKAAVKVFHDHCRKQGIELHSRNFTIRYNSDIPHQVGLAGSSAIITACMRALMAFYGVTIPMPQQANLILSVEKDELRIAAGLQDRVAQVYQGLVYMDFAEAHMRAQGHGHYEELDPGRLPPLYVAYLADLAKESGVVHSDVTERFRRGDPEVLDAVRYWIGITEEVRERLLRGEGGAIAPLLDGNFDRRAKLYPITEGNLRMIRTARATGASAKFTGSGGAIVGTYDGEAMFEALRERLRPMNVQVLKPVIAPAREEA